MLTPPSFLRRSSPLCQHPPSPTDLRGHARVPKCGTRCSEHPQGSRDGLQQQVTCLSPGHRAGNSKSTAPSAAPAAAMPKEGVSPGAQPHAQPPAPRLERLALPRAARCLQMHTHAIGPSFCSLFCTERGKRTSRKLCEASQRTGFKNTPR